MFLRDQVSCSYLKSIEVGSTAEWLDIQQRRPSCCCAKPPAWKGAQFVTVKGVIEDRGGREKWRLGMRKGFFVEERRG